MTFHPCGKPAHAGTNGNRYDVLADESPVSRPGDAPLSSPDKRTCLSSHVSPVPPGCDPRLGKCVLHNDPNRSCRTGSRNCTSLRCQMSGYS